MRSGFPIAISITCFCIRSCMLFVQKSEAHYLIVQCSDIQHNLYINVGTHKYGEFNHSCMYYDLWINGPKETLEYPDYTYEEHFGKLLPSFAPRAAVRDYLEGQSRKMMAQKHR